EAEDGHAPMTRPTGAMPVPPSCPSPTRGSCTLILRIHATGPSHAVCWVLTRRLLLLSAGLQNLVQPNSLPRGPTCHTPSHDHDPRQLLIALEAATTAARDKATLLEASISDLSAQQPSPVYRAATSGLTLCRWSAQA